MLHKVSTIALCGRRNTFASFSEDELHEAGAAPLAGNSCRASTCAVAGTQASEGSPTDLCGRHTKDSPAVVRNAIVQQGTSRVRCSFWHEQAQELAEQQPGACVMPYQVLISKRKDETSWEIWSQGANFVAGV